MKNSELKAVPEKPKSLPEKIADLKKALENFVANANRQVARMEGAIEAYEEIQKSQKEAQPDAD
jgi:predicted  nucleic acid-binding Zn-ribbon protein